MPDKPRRPCACLAGWVTKGGTCLSVHFPPLCTRHYAGICAFVGFVDAYALRSFLKRAFQHGSPQSECLTAVLSLSPARTKACRISKRDEDVFFHGCCSIGAA